MCKHAIAIFEIWDVMSYVLSQYVSGWATGAI